VVATSQLAAAAAAAAAAVEEDKIENLAAMMIAETAELAAE
jgi:hypothetical protein